MRLHHRFSLRLRGPLVLPQLAPALTLPGSLGLAGRLLLPITAFVLFGFTILSIGGGFGECQDEGQIIFETPKESRETRLGTSYFIPGGQSSPILKPGTY